MAKPVDNTFEKQLKNTQAVIESRVKCTDPKQQTVFRNSLWSAWLKETFWGTPTQENREVQS